MERIENIAAIAQEFTASTQEVAASISMQNEEISRISIVAQEILDASMLLRAEA